MTTLKQQLSTWAEALTAYEAQDFEGCVRLFESIQDEGAKFHFNIGVVHATVGSHELAVQHFEEAISTDRFLAVAYFQSGVSNFLLERFPEARRDFNDAYVYLRGNQTIDYEQLGLKFRLYSCEVLFNRGLASLNMDEGDEGIQDLQAASREKQINPHDVIDEALTDRGKGYTVFSIPVGVLYRPSDSKLKNLKTKNYLGSATLVAATDQQDAFTGFTGVTLARNATLLRSAAVFGTDITQPTAPGLSRSKSLATPGDQHKISLSGDSPAPLRRNQTAAAAVPSFSTTSRRPVPPRGAGPARNNFTLLKGTATGTLLSGLPSPPSSDDVPFPAPLVPETTYDDELDIYAVYGRHTMAADAGPRPEGQPFERVANWAQQNFGTPPSAPLSRNTSASETGETVLKPVARSKPTPVPAGRGRGGGMGYTDSVAPQEDAFTTVSEREMTKIRVKLRYRNETRGMSIAPDTALEDFVERVRRKLQSPSDLPMRYKDSVGELISIVDADDFETAIDEARESAKGGAEGKLEILVHE